MKKILLFLIIFSSPMYILYFKIGGQPLTLFRLVFIISAIYIVLLTCLRFKVKLAIKKWLLLFIVFFIGYYFISWIQVEKSYVKVFATSKMISICVFFATIYIMSFLIDSKELIVFSLKSIIITCSIVCLFNLLNYYTIINYGFNFIDLTDSKMDSHNFLATFGEGGVRLPGTFFDTNVFGVYILSTILILFYYKNNFYHKNIFKLNLLVIFLLINLGLTFSRSSFLIFGINIILIKFFIEYFSAPKIKNVMSLLISFTLIAILTINYGQDFLNNIVFRFSSSGSNSLRLFRAKAGIDSFLESPMLGNEMYHYHSALSIFDFENKAPTTHSLYLDMLSDIGIIGSLSFIGFIYYIFYSLYKRYSHSKEKLFLYLKISIINILIFQIIYSSFFNPTFAVQFGLAVAMLNYPMINKESKIRKTLAS